MQTTAPAKNKTSIQVIRSGDRGHANHGWLDARHSFSFGNYYNPERMNYQSLRVINEDRISPGRGFGTHPHASMEIFTYVISGQLQHKDSMGNGRIIRAGEFQYMSAGSGVQHSEFNPSEEKETHLLQIWISPDSEGGEPLYVDLDIETLKQKNDPPLTLLASGHGRRGSQAMRQNAEIYFGQLTAGQRQPMAPDQNYMHHYLHVISGSLQIDAHTLEPGDAVMIDGDSPTLTAAEDSTFLYFNL